MESTPKMFPDTTPCKIMKPWGYEHVFVKTNYYIGKALHVKAGNRTSLQFHINKQETLYVINGRCEVILGDIKNDLIAGGFLHIDAGEIHRIIGITDCEILEISTPHQDDIVRLEDDYNRV